MGEDMKIETFDMYGTDSVHCGHKHDDGDKYHRCNSTNTETQTDCVTGLMFWHWLQCNDCKLGMIFGGGSED